jgi:hypothetical protein
MHKRTKEAIAAAGGSALMPSTLNQTTTPAAKTAKQQPTRTAKPSTRSRKAQTA